MGGVGRLGWWADVCVSSLPRQFMESSGLAAMGTAAPASLWSSWYSRYWTATRPSLLPGLTTASAQARWVRDSQRGWGGVWIERQIERDTKQPQVRRGSAVNIVLQKYKVVKITVC